MPIFVARFLADVILKVSRKNGSAATIDVTYVDGTTTKTVTLKATSTGVAGHGAIKNRVKVTKVTGIASLALKKAIIKTIQKHVTTTGGAAGQRGGSTDVAANAAEIQQVNAVSEIDMQRIINAGELVNYYKDAHEFSTNYDTTSLGIPPSNFLGADNVNYNMGVFGDSTRDVVTPAYSGGSRRRGAARKQ